MGFHSRRQAVKISRKKFHWSLCCCRPLGSLHPHWVLPGASTSSFLIPVVPSVCTAIFPDLSWWCHCPRRWSPQACGAIHLAPSPSPQHRRPPQVHDAINPATSPSPRQHQLYAIPVLTTSSSSPSPRCRRPRNATLYIFLCHYAPTNPKFDMPHWHIALICYIVLICYTLLLFCCIALICYIATLLWYVTFLLYATHCYIA
jgi:hypothetical protein